MRVDRMVRRCSRNLGGCGQSSVSTELAAKGLYQHFENKFLPSGGKRLQEGVKSSRFYFGWSVLADVRKKKRNLEEIWFLEVCMVIKEWHLVQIVKSGLVGVSALVLLVTAAAAQLLLGCCKLRCCLGPLVTCGVWSSAIYTFGRFFSGFFTLRRVMGFVTFYPLLHGRRAPFMTTLAAICLLVVSTLFLTHSGVWSGSCNLWRQTVLLLLLSQSFLSSGTGFS